MAGEKSDQVAQQAQNFFNKGVAAFERGNLDIAIDLLMQCVTMAPGFSRAILRTNFRTSRSARPVSVQELTMTRSLRAGSTSKRSPPF